MLLATAHSSLRYSKHDKNGTKKTQEKHKKLSSSTKPLKGKVFYLDLPANKRSEALENDIQGLGGTVEKFFSKDIRYLVSSKPEARHVYRRPQELPVPSPESGVSSPRPSSSKEGPRSSSHGPPEPTQVSRGKALVEKVVKEQERFQMNKIFSNALEWGVKILHVEDVEAYIEKKRPIISSQKKPNSVVVKKGVKTTCDGRTSSLKHNVRRISTPFVKVEDSSRRFRPLYLHMAHMPVCNFSSAPPANPFQTEEKKHSTHRPEKHAGKGKHRRQEGREKRRAGYCECCGATYDKLQAHLKGERHQTFVAGNHYQQLDALIAQLPWVFAQEPPPQSAKLSDSTAPICVPVRSDRTETAGAIGQEEQGGGEHQSLAVTAASCSSLRKRGRESPSRTNRDSSDEAVHVPETSKNKRGSFMWESCPTLWRAPDDPPDLHLDTGSHTAGVGATSGTQRHKGRTQNRLCRSRRRTQSSSRVTDQKHTDTPGSASVSREETETLFGGLHQESPVESIQDRSVCATQQNSIKNKPVELTGSQLDFIQEETLDPTKQESAHDRLFNTFSKHNSQQDLRQGKPADAPQEQQSIHIKHVHGTRRDSWEPVQESAVHGTETQSFRTIGPGSSKGFLKRKKRSVHFAVQDHPVQPQDTTDTPNPTANPTANALSEAEEGWTAEALRPVWRRVRGQRSWSRGQSSSLGPPSTELQQAEEDGDDALSGMYLWELFQDDEDEDDDMQEEFLGFAC
ncbi:hypothetical protein ACEWY4_019696 [Coilia grayii]|uniref:Protein DBF4 homolog A n=1 Tax=Coilia grayii TaxID=363190 RepID=A0ABD1JAG2_9TELE